MPSTPASYSGGTAVPATYRSEPSRVPASGRAFARRGAEAIAKWFGAEPDLGGVVDQEYDELFHEIGERMASVEDEQSRRRELFRVLDNLYHPNERTLGGADHWADDPSATIKGRAHISVNVHPAYVTIPATLQAVTPVINVVPIDPSKEERERANRIENLYFQWREDVGYDLIDEDVCLIKALYGDTAAKVYWDTERKMPAVEVIESPENLYLGYGSSDYRRIDWALYRMSMSPQAIKEEFGLDVEMQKGKDGEYKPVVYYAGDHSDPLNQTGRFGQPILDQTERARRDAAYERCQVEVIDYWYKTPPKKAGGKPTTWNAIYVGDIQVKNQKHTEYEGELPYVTIVNQRIPRSPYGKPELWDVEQLLRDKDERITDGAAMIHSIVGGQRYQLVGTEAPTEMPDNAIPQPNKIATPGPNAEIKAIQPFIPQYAIEDHNKRIDRELAVVSGLNDLLLGLAPAQTLGSSRAVSALIANYESRINPKRKLKYDFDKRVWRLAARIWEKKDKDVRDIIDGNYRLEIVAPNLTPRDQLEIANTAISLVDRRIWSSERAMDATGVEDPTDEKAIIREEQTDPAMNPAAVQAQMTLFATAASLGVPVPGAPQGPQSAGPTQAQTSNTARTLNRPPAGTASLNQPENAAQPAPEAQPTNATGSAVAQSLLQDGEASGRILTQLPVTGEGAE